jgi:hypothetical protein
MIRIGCFCASLSLFSTILGQLSLAAERIDLSPDRASDRCARISIQLDAGGHSLVRGDGVANGNDAQQKLRISVAAKLQYDELRLASAMSEVAQTAPLAIRYYDEAKAVIKVEDSGKAPQLDDDRRLIVVARRSRDDENRPALYCPDGILTREQLDLIDVVGNSLFIDRLLPTDRVATGQSWRHEAAVIGPLLTLDTVAVSEVQSVLDEYNASFAKIRMAGTAHGTADGAATEVEVRGVYLFDRRARRITRFNLAVHERRSIGGATPGLDAIAKVQIQVEPLENSPHLEQEIVAKAKAADRTPLVDLIYESGPLGLRLKHDRKWYVTSESRQSVTLARVDQADLIAQCTMTALAAKSAGRQTSLEKFQEDVIYSLGKSFGEMVSSRQWQNAAGYLCYELVARGMVQEVPVEWHYYLVAPESGDRVSLAFTLEKPMVERIGGADRVLVESLELFPRMPAVETTARQRSQSLR